VTKPRLPLLEALGDWSSGTGPRYARLHRAIDAAIASGEILPGAPLPPERILAQALGLSRTTVVLAYQQLRQSGRVDSRQGSGTWVRRSPQDLHPSPQEHEVTSAFRRNVVFRSLLEHAGDTISLVGAYLPPSPAVEEAMRRLARSPHACLGAEPGYSPMGLPALRQAVAASLSRADLPTVADQVLITSGAQQAISLVAGLLVPRGETVAVEDPTYIGAIDVFSAAGARLLPVPSGPAGVDVGRLRPMLETRPRLLYLVPTFHNPTGAIMPEASRREIARLAAEFQIPVVEDMALAGLGLGAAPPPPIATFAKDAPILTVGSPSKLFWSGLRVGWIRGPEPLIARLGRWKALADLGSPLLTQALAVDLLAEETAAQKLRRRESQGRLDLLGKLLKQHLPDWTWQRPEGGLLLWARIPSGDANDLARIAQRHGVAIVPGSANSPDHRFSDRVRLPFVADPPSMTEAILRLARAWKEYQPLSNRSGGRFDVIV
jgi:DNA-binding transcriptional MocR family regulator